MTGQELTLQQGEQPIESERAELAASVDELTRRASPAALVPTGVDRLRPYAAPGAVVVVALVAIRVFITRIRRSRRSAHRQEHHDRWGRS